MKTFILIIFLCFSAYGQNKINKDNIVFSDDSFIDFFLPISHHFVKDEFESRLQYKSRIKKLSEKYKFKANESAAKPTPLNKLLFIIEPTTIGYNAEQEYFYIWHILSRDTFEKKSISCNIPIPRAEARYMKSVIKIGFKGIPKITPNDYFIFNLQTFEIYPCVKIKPKPKPSTGILQ